MSFGQVRLQKLGELERTGVNPYPYKFQVSAYIEDIVTNPVLDSSYQIAGRLKTVRRMGRLTFADLWETIQDFKFL